MAKPLLRTLAQYAEFVGWLQQDGGDLHAAMRWSDRANQFGPSPRRLPATTAVDLASAAQDVPSGIDPRIRALAAQQEARGWAMLGDVDHCRRQLDTVAELLRVDPGETDPIRPDPSTSSITTWTPSMWRSGLGGPISLIPAPSTRRLPPAERREHHASADGFI